MLHLFMKLSKEEIKHEVKEAIILCQEIIDHGAETDVDDIQHSAKKIQLALMRVNSDVL